MPRKRHHASQRLVQQAVELSIAAPQVVAHRVTRLATAGAQPTAADLHEMVEMGHEKAVAFSQGWLAMWTAAARLPAQLAAAPLAHPATHFEAAARVVSAGLAPVHAKAVSNARRLGRRHK